jgi:hypothetical protein
MRRKETREMSGRSEAWPTKGASGPGLPQLPRTRAPASTSEARHGDETQNRIRISLTNKR